MIKIPKRFYEDHVECDCLGPKLIKSTKQYHFIDSSNKYLLSELISRANYYVEMGKLGGLVDGYQGLVKSAQYTLKAIENQGYMPNKEEYSKCVSVMNEIYQDRTNPLYQHIVDDAQDIAW